MALLAAAFVFAKMDRVADARLRKEAVIAAKAKRLGVAYPFHRVFFRAFKRERQLQVFVADGDTYTKYGDFDIAALSGNLGPKRKEGDRQVPEGLYAIDRFNPTSRFLLSMRVAYPNASDRALSDPRAPGSDIYIHGGHSSIGCLAMTDDTIQELYLLAFDSWKAGGESPQILILPYRAGILVRDWPTGHAKLWAQLYAINRRFNKTSQLPEVRIEADGAYRLPK